MLFFPSKDADWDNEVYRLEGYFHGIFHELVDICLNHEWRLTYNGGEQVYRDTKKSSCAWNRGSSKHLLTEGGYRKSA